MLGRSARSPAASLIVAGCRRCSRRRPPARDRRAAVRRVLHLCLSLLRAPRAHHDRRARQRQCRQPLVARYTVGLAWLAQTCAPRYSCTDGRQPCFARTPQNQLLRWHVRITRADHREQPVPTSWCRHPGVLDLAHVVRELAGLAVRPLTHGCALIATAWPSCSGGAGASDAVRQVADRRRARQMLRSPFGVRGCRQRTPILLVATSCSRPLCSSRSYRSASLRRGPCSSCRSRARRPAADLQDEPI